MKPIVTLTLNPAVDSSSEVEEVYPIRKIRTSKERFDPGGGGINAARVINELGGRAFAVYLGGGRSGDVLDELVASSGVDFHRIRTEEATRISHVVFERKSGKEYRFTPEGPVVHDDEWRAALAFIDLLDFDYLIASGSLPRGAPGNLYGRIAEVVMTKGAKLILDTSGPALAEALGRGVHVAKPSLGEFRTLIGEAVEVGPQLQQAMQRATQQGLADVLAVTMGEQGAALASGETYFHLPALEVDVKSAVGAGDSFVAGMTVGLSQGLSLEQAFALGAASGTATVLTPGTELCHKDDDKRLKHRLIELSSIS